MKRQLTSGILVCFLVCLGFGNSIAQPGFKKLYTGDFGLIFADILWDGEKLITTGQIVSDTSYNGLFSMELDTLGNILNTESIFYPNDILASQGGNSIISVGDSSLYYTTQFKYNNQGVILRKKEGGNFELIEEYDHTGTVIWFFDIKFIDGELYVIGRRQNNQFDIGGFINNYDLDGNLNWSEELFASDLFVSIGDMVKHDGKITVLTREGHFDIDNPPSSNWAKSQFYTLNENNSLDLIFDGPINEENGGNSLAQTTDKNWIYSTAVYKISSDGNSGGGLPKIVCRDSSFNLLWQREFGSHLSSLNYANKIIPAGNDEYIVTGELSHDLSNASSFFHKFKADGDSLWTYFDNYTPSIDLYFQNYFDGVILPSGSLFAVGYQENVGNPAQGILLKLDKNGCVDTFDCMPSSTIKVDHFPEISIFPNPTADIINITNPVGKSIDIYTLEGLIVGNYLVSGKKQQLNLENLPSGIYIVKMYDNKHSLNFMVSKI